MPTSREVTLAVSELRIVLGQLIRRLRAEHALPISQGIVLGYLDRGGPATASALAAVEHVRPQSMAQTVAELEAEGLVDRTPDPTDGRRILIGLTAEGRAALATERRRREGWLAEAIAELDEDEQALLVRAVPLLRRLSER